MADEDFNDDSLGLAQPAIRSLIFRGLSSRLLGLVLSYLPGRSPLRCSTGLHPEDLEVLRPCCPVLRETIDTLPERRVMSAYRAFRASAAVAGSNVEKLELSLREALVSAQHSYEVAASWTPSIYSWQQNDADRALLEQLEPFRVAAKFLRYSSFAGSGSSDRDDSAHGSSFIARIPLLAAGSGSSNRAPDVWLGVHWLDESAYSARYQERSMDSAGDVWLQAVQQDSSSLAKFKTAASRLGLEVSGDRRGFTSPLPVWRAERTFYCEETAGLDGGFFERLAAYVGLPGIAPPDIYEPPPASAWPGMLWLSMVLGSGCSLWEWYFEEKPADSTTVPDTGEAFELPAPETDSEESKFLDALGPLIDQACEAGTCEAAVNGLKCAAVERQLRQPATAARLTAACKALHITPLATAFLTKNSRLVHFDSSDFSSRHDYCSVHSTCATLLLPLLPGGAVELRTSFSSGCGYERDDKEATIELQLCGPVTLDAVDPQSMEKDEWLQVVFWGPGERRGHEEEEGDGSENEEPCEGIGRGEPSSSRTKTHELLEAVAMQLLPAGSANGRITVGRQLARFALTHAAFARGDGKYALDTVRSFMPGLTG